MIVQGSISYKRTLFFYGYYFTSQNLKYIPKNYKRLNGVFASGYAIGSHKK